MKLLVRSAVVLILVGAAFAQTQSGQLTPKGEVAIVSLSRLVYPPLARQARIMGDVEIKLEIRKDGSVQSAVMASGHPMLSQAALASAQQSHFECRRCEDEVKAYSIVYSFQEASSPGWPCPESFAPRISRVENHVTITTEPSLVYPYFASTRARSIKCLFIWRCGLQWGGEDYYYYKIRSAKCLGLWNCEHRLREPFATCLKLHRKMSY